MGKVLDHMVSGPVAGHVAGFSMSTLNILTASGQVITWFALGKGHVHILCPQRRPPPPKKNPSTPDWQNGPDEVPGEYRVEILIYECKMLTKKDI